MILAIIGTVFLAFAFGWLVGWWMSQFDEDRPYNDPEQKSLPRGV